MFLSPYVYEPIAHGYFRLITLEPGGTDAQLVASVSHAPLLTDFQTPYYEAISYTWGSADLKDILYIQGKGTLRITATLPNALARLRYIDRPRTLWADAVCICQDNLEEKSHQVALMTEIYSRADKVLVHLGDGDGASDTAMDCVKDFERVVTRQDALLGGRLFERPWFTRMWVVQEVARSRAAIVICGTYCVAWDCFARWPYRAVPRIATSRKQSTSIRRRMPTSQHVPIIPSILNYASGYTPSAGSERLLEILHENRSALAGDARDKIFGTLGLMADITPYMHLIDYSRSIPDVYTTFARQILRDTKSFRILSAAGLSRGIPRHALPSWVPDWSHVKSEAPLGLGKTLDEPFNAGGRSCNIHRESSVNTLSTTGVQVAIITGLGLETVLGRDGRLDVDIMYSWNHLFETTCGTRSSAATQTSPIANRRSPLHTQFSTSHASGSRGNADDSFDVPHGKAFLETIGARPVSTLSPDKISARKHLSSTILHLSLSDHEQRRIARVTYNRRFFIAKQTALGGEEQLFMGLGPATLECGDIVVVLLGGPVPYALRPSPRLSGHQLVGECYVHGIMGGEALHHVREEVEAAGCMLPPTSIQRCSQPLATFDLI